MEEADLRRRDIVLLASSPGLRWCDAVALGILVSYLLLLQESYRILKNLTAHLSDWYDFQKGFYLL